MNFAILSVQLSGIKYIHIVQLKSIHLQNFFHLLKLKLVPV